MTVKISDIAAFLQVFQRVSDALGRYWECETDDKTEESQEFDVILNPHDDDPAKVGTERVRLKCDLRLLSDHCFVVAVACEAGGVSSCIDLKDVADPAFSKRLLMLEAARMIIFKIATKHK